MKIIAQIKNVVGTFKDKLRKQDREKKINMIRKKLNMYLASLCLLSM